MISSSKSAASKAGPPTRPAARWMVCVAVTSALIVSPTRAQTRAMDIFGRSLQDRGVTLVDWDGYLANPLIKISLLPPANAVLPGLVTLTGDGGRLYFEMPGTVSPDGPTKTVAFSNPTTSVPVGVSIFPDRDGLDEDYTLTMIFTGADGVRQTNALPIHVVDQDLQRPNEFIVTVNFDRDATGIFSDSTRRGLTVQVANDWAYFFAGMNLDSVAAGAESTYIWSDNFSGGYDFTNTNQYTGYLLYAYGTTNRVHRSGGEASFYGRAQTSGGVPLPLHRSGGFESEIYGNYNTLGWRLLPDDTDWLASGNLGNETNDFASIAHHEIGHALIFNPGHPGFNVAKSKGAFTSRDVTNYYGGPVPIDAFDHLNGVIDPESGQGAFGYEYYGTIPRKRWIMTKLDLLCAQEVGYGMRPSSAFTPLTVPVIDPPPGAQQGVPYQVSFAASGGIPIYHWDIVAGALPPGLMLDGFTGTISGTPATTGTFAFSLRVRDYHEGAPGITRPVVLNVGSPPEVRLTLSITGQGAARRSQLVVWGGSGQQRVIQASNDLLTWVPVTTNLSGVSPFEFQETDPLAVPHRFYRARVFP